MIEIKRLFLKNINNEKQTIQDLILKGTPDDYCRYRELVGKLKGIEEVEYQFNQIWDRYVEKGEL